ncbi:MAG TPA: SRPBCC domain-containing protein [Verrucomicrobiae bacterium]|jgi:uncharacterized protein YndB with AHSA1/START domain|nr:SRPBCC domain-containing protein [Verrucomicrobiae bacterium]
MIKHYTCRVMIEGSVVAVYDALTTEAGLRGWWTRTCEVGKRVGEQSTFRFGKMHNVMRIEKLRPDSEVCWHCVEQHHDGLQQVDEWKGTQVSFRLMSQTPGRTLLDFEHRGLAPQLECFAICERGWDHFLKTSLKNYVETGRGEPFIPET